jgi:hypothetical protein
VPPPVPSRTVANPSPPAPRRSRAAAVPPPPPDSALQAAATCLPPRALGSPSPPVRRRPGTPHRRRSHPARLPDAALATEERKLLACSLPHQRTKHLKRLWMVVVEPPTFLIAAKLHTSKVASPPPYSILQQAKGQPPLPSRRTPRHPDINGGIVRQVREFDIPSPHHHHCLLQLHVLMSQWLQTIVVQ